MSCFGFYNKIGVINHQSGWISGLMLFKIFAIYDTTDVHFYVKFRIDLDSDT